MRAIRRMLEIGKCSSATVEIDTVRGYANWGGEFLDDAVRFEEEPLTSVASNKVNAH